MRHRPVRFGRRVVFFCFRKPAVKLVEAVPSCEQQNGTVFFQWHCCRPVSPVTCAGEGVKHSFLVAVLQSAARARCTGPTCGRRYERRGSPRGSAPTTSNAPPWHRGADDQAQRMTPGKRSRASTTAAGRRAAPSHGGRAAAARNLRYNANRARPSTGKHTPRLGHSVPRARERGWLLAREGSFRDPLHDHARIIPRPGGRRDCNQSSRAACRSLGRLGRRGGEQGTQL